tara:strand:+ start:685 stop:1509 length:825 start_codon:yes stop_codon:yes gene_type:complete
LSENSNEYKIVLSAVASIYDSPIFNSELVTQALLWEKLIILDKKDNWYKVEQRDGYIGWIHSFYTTDSSIYEEYKFLENPENWYWVKKKFLSLNNKSNSLVSFGSLIPCFNQNEKNLLLLPNNKKISIAETSLVRFTDKKDYKKMVLCSALELLNTPYLWGGKSSFGFDCSGLVQTIVNVSSSNTGNSKRLFFPRDASKQVLSDTLIPIKDEPSVGNIIFFQSKNKVDHVGIYINNIDFIHSSGFVKLNSINTNSQYYSNELEKKVYGIYKIKL